MTAKKKNLVIVESPAKARTIERLLGSDYDVMASVGHVRDLPVWGLGVDIKNDFKPKYQVPKDRRDVVKKLKTAAAKARTVFLATDPDREGEAISWHLSQAIELEGTNIPVRRVVFHEITQNAIDEAFRSSRDIDLRLVDAQQARRIVDRLIGYKMSPLVTRKIRRGKLSAGRVQSVSVRMVVDREREVRAFRPVEYWSVAADLAKRQGSASERKPFEASLHSELGANRKIEVPNERAAAELVALLNSATYTVSEVRPKEERRNPSAPFTTSTLQQEAGRKLGYTARKTMSSAQKLYEGLEHGAEGEGGLITYMRTDSTNVAESARRDAAAFIKDRYGADSLPPKPRVYTKKAKSAQEAHEAIRPTSVFRTPADLKKQLPADQFKIYDLIWKRFVASQMASAVLDTISVDIRADTSARPYLFRLTGSRVKFAGFRNVYLEGKDDDQDGDQDDAGMGLPALVAGEILDLKPPVAAEQHFTQPPPRYTEASLIKALEEEGIGRPSTYAPTMSTILDRGYVERNERRLHPTDLGFQVNDMLVEFFPNIVDLKFTARMENDLDEVASGERQMVPIIEEFYDPFAETLEHADKSIEKAPDEPAGEDCEKCGSAMVWRYSRYGRFMGCSAFPKCRNLKPEPKPEPVTTGVKCPNCHQGELVERQSRRKRRANTFFGCTRYPDCDFISNDRPLSEPCPKCGSLMVITAKNAIKCSNKDCDHEIPVEQAERQPASV